MEVPIVEFNLLEKDLTLKIHTIYEENTLHLADNLGRLDVCFIMCKTKFTIYTLLIRDNIILRVDIM